MSTELSTTGETPARKTRQRKPGKRALDKALPHPRLVTGARMRTKAGLVFFVDGVQESLARDEPTVSWHYLRSGKRMSMRMLRAQHLLRGAQVMPPLPGEADADARALQYLDRCSWGLSWVNGRAELRITLPEGMRLEAGGQPRNILAAAQVLA
jgi:hypothetical protein